MLHCRTVARGDSPLACSHSQWGGSRQPWRAAGIADEKGTLVPEPGRLVIVWSIPLFWYWKDGGLSGELALE